MLTFSAVAKSQNGFARILKGSCPLSSCPMRHFCSRGYTISLFIHNSRLSKSLPPTSMPYKKFETACAWNKTMRDVSDSVIRFPSKSVSKEYLGHFTVLVRNQCSKAVKAKRSPSKRSSNVLAHLVRLTSNLIMSEMRYLGTGLPSTWSMTIP